MAYEIKLNEEVHQIEMWAKEGNLADFKIDNRHYTVDIVEVEHGVYSILLDGISYNVELLPTENKKYLVNTLYNAFDVEIIDAETKYKNSRKSAEAEDSNYISTPMPGKVVKILVNEGDRVKGGDTVIIVSAMKMESEYKVVKDRLITKILVKEGDNIDGHQPLIMLE
ncbi:MAG: biotin/lipoyl-binding protein [Bacteroidales bacterium]|jgi:biotin carboxyl carrier protein|nr:biotin/lipoyl-binding protein [Bacteroidales bacterium]